MPEMENNESLSSNNPSTFNFRRQLEPVNIISEEAPVKNEQNSNEKNADVLLNDEFFVDLLMRSSVSVLPEQIDDTSTDKNPHNSDHPNLSIERNDSDNLFSDKEQNQNLMKSPAIDSDEMCTPFLIDITGEDQNEDSDNSITECTISATPSNGIRKSDTNSIPYTEAGCLKSSNENSDEICEIEVIEAVAKGSQNISISKQDFDNSTTECTISATPTNGIRKSDTNSIQYTETDSFLKSCNESSVKICEIQINEAIAEDSQSISVNKEDVDNSTRECTISTMPTNGLGKSDTNSIQYTETDSCLKPSNENSEKICEIEIIEAVTEDSQSISIINKQLNNTLIENFSKDEYRCESDVWTDDEDSSSSDSSSSDSETFFQAMQDNFDRSKPKKITPVKTKGELGLDDLPPIEDLTISVEENEMTVIGKVHAIVETLVVIRSFKDMKALDLDSVLFLFHDRPLGRVFDVFGPVNEPFYSIRFNNIDQINEKGVQVGAEVYFAPEKMDITLYVFVEDLQKQKGSDASWKDNNEPPVEFLDYSDDEEERRSKRERMMKNRNEQFSKDCDAPAKRALLSDNSSTTYIPPPKPATSYQNNVRQFTQRFSTPNPFLSRMPPPSPSVSVCSVMSPVRVQHSFYSPPSQPRPPVLVHPQNILSRPPPSIFRSPYQQQPPIFGQISVLNPLPSPSYPTLIPASPFTPPPTQNYFRHEFARSPSPGFQVQRLPSDLQSPNRHFSSPNVHPSHPLTVEIPSVNDSSFPGHSQQQFMNHQSANVNSFQVPNNSFQVPNMNNASFAIHQYPQVRNPMQQFSSFPSPNFNNTFMPNVNFPPGNGQPRFYR